MKSLGRVSSIEKTGSMLIRTKRLPELYSQVVTDNKKVVGTVSDIIGPVMDPYVVVKVRKDILQNPSKFKDKELFELKSKDAKKRAARWKKER